MRKLRDLLVSEDGEEWRIPEICAAFGFSDDTVRREIQAGELPAYRPARRPRGPWLVSHAALRAYAVKIRAIPA